MLEERIIGESNDITVALNSSDRCSCSWFLSTIVSGLVAVVMLLLVSIVLFVLFFARRDLIRFNCDSPANLTACDEDVRVFGAAVPGPVFPTLTAVIGALAALATALIGHLTAFHAFLSKVSIDVLLLFYSCNYSLQGNDNV